MKGEGRWMEEGEMDGMGDGWKGGEMEGGEMDGRERGDGWKGEGR